MIDIIDDYYSIAGIRESQISVGKRIVVGGVKITTWNELGKDKKSKE